MRCESFKSIPQALVAAALAMLAASPAAPSQAPVAAQHRYSQLDVLVVVLLNVTHDDVRTSLAGRNLTKVFVELERARLFYWRNSRMRLNPNLTYAVVATPVSFSGLWLPDYVVRRAVSGALERVGVWWGDFDSVVALWAAPNYREEPDPVGSVWGPGDTVHRFSSYQLNGAIAWLFVHEFHTRSTSSSTGAATRGTPTPTSRLG